MYELMKLIFLVFFLAHLIACGFYLVSINSNMHHSWLVKENLLYENWSI